MSYYILIVSTEANHNKKKKRIIDNNTIHYLLCRVITQDCLTFIIYYEYTYCICIIIYNNV